MTDFVRCTVRSGFQQQLERGTASFKICAGMRADTLLFKLEKGPSVDYWYRIPVGEDNSISYQSDPQFCGVYDRQCRTLYLTPDALPSFTGGRTQAVTEVGPSMTEEISGRINQWVEECIANDRNNLSVYEITGSRARYDLKSYLEDGAKREAVERFFGGREPDGQFHSAYALEELPEVAFLSYIRNPEDFIRSEAEQYIKDNQEKFLLQFLKNDALLAEYQALVQDTGNPLHRVKAISEAIKASGAKTVTVTVQRDGEELSFRTGTTPLRGRYNSYSASHISAADRREFERLFGRYADYHAEEITKITYGRHTLYEAPTVQIEDYSTTGMTMGGMEG